MIGEAPGLYKFRPEKEDPMKTKSSRRMFLQTGLSLPAAAFVIPPGILEAVFQQPKGKKPPVFQEPSGHPEE